MRKIALFLVLCLLLPFVTGMVFGAIAEGDLPPLISTPIPSSTEPTDEEPDAPEQYQEPTPDPETLLRLHQINIGYGDAYLLTVGDWVILVDCGTNTTDPVSTGRINYPLFTYLEACKIDHIDVHFVTHWHNDHDYNVNLLGALYGTEDTMVYGVTEKLYKEFDPLVAGTYQELRDGDRLSIGPLEVLVVGPEYKEGIPGNRNIDSMNFVVTYGDVTMMFTGDFIQSGILKRWWEEITDIDILSFPHHGAEIQETPVAPYRVINPRLVLISSAERGIVRNYAMNYAHAPQDAVYLSYLDGHVLVSTDGENIWYATNVIPGELPLGELLPPREN
ncbi:MAG: MBL fold metallo-hydrolase [Clostridia bacterium]|nr:MBL fold metallo-hydrolase [Clostridia bacterium]